jgi:hypothetical protein
MRAPHPIVWQQSWAVVPSPTFDHQFWVSAQQHQVGCLVGRAHHQLGFPVLPPPTLPCGSLPSWHGANCRQQVGVNYVPCCFMGLWATILKGQWSGVCIPTVGVFCGWVERDGWWGGIVQLHGASASLLRGASAKREVGACMVQLLYCESDAACRSCTWRGMVWQCCRNGLAVLPTAACSWGSISVLGAHLLPCLLPVVLS